MKLISISTWDQEMQQFENYYLNYEMFIDTAKATLPQKNGMWHEQRKDHGIKYQEKVLC